MRATVNSVNLYFEEKLINQLSKEKLYGQVTAQCCDGFDDRKRCEAVEIEFKIVGEDDAWIASTLTYDNALFLANSILRILEFQKSRI